MSPSHRSLDFKEKSRRPAEDLALLHVARDWVRGRLPRSALRPEFSSCLDHFAAALVFRVRDDPQARLILAAKGSGPGSYVEATEAAFSEVVFECVERDETLLWELTHDLIHQNLMRMVGRGRVAGSEASERFYEIRMNALAQLEGGHKVLAKFREKGSVGSPPFWPYLQTSVNNAIVDELRKKGDNRSFWAGKLPQADTRPDLGEGGGGQVLMTRSDAEHRLARARRARDRERAIEMLLALADLYPTDPDFKMAARFIRWQQSLPSDAARSQAAFAKAHQLPPGTVNANMSRFRTKAQVAATAARLPSLFTTTGA